MPTYADYRLDDTMAKTPPPCSTCCVRSGSRPARRPRPSATDLQAALARRAQRRRSRPGTGASMPSGCGKAAIRSRRGRAEAVFRAGEHGRAPCSTRRPAVRRQVPRDAGPAALPPGRPRLRGGGQPRRTTHVGLFLQRQLRPRRQAVRRLDEQLPRSRMLYGRGDHADHRQQQQLRQEQADAADLRRRRRRCSTNSATRCTAC